jgi:hypothetical protein
MLTEQEGFIMQQGGDRGKSPNVTGTQPKGRMVSANEKGTKGRAGQGSAKSRKGSPKKVEARTTSKSKDK